MISLVRVNYRIIIYGNCSCASAEIETETETDLQVARLKSKHETASCIEQHAPYGVYLLFYQVQHQTKLQPTSKRQFSQVRVEFVVRVLATGPLTRIHSPITNDLENSQSTLHKRRLRDVTVTTTNRTPNPAA